MATRSFLLLCIICNYGVTCLSVCLQHLLGLHVDKIDWLSVSNTARSKGEPFMLTSGNSNGIAIKVA